MDDVSFEDQLTALKAACATFASPFTGEAMGEWRVRIPLPEEVLGPDMCPFIGIFPFPGTAQASNVTVWGLPIDINYFHEGVPDDLEYQMPLKLYDVPRLLFRHLVADTALMATTYGMQTGEPAFSAGSLAWHAQMYAGATLSTIFKTKENTQWA